VFNDGFDLLVFHGVGLQCAPCGRLAKTMVNMMFAVEYFNVFLNRFSCAFGIFETIEKSKTGQLRIFQTTGICASFDLIVDAHMNF